MNEITKENIIIYIKNYYKSNLKSPTMNDNHPFKYYHIKKYFNTWNTALKESGIPLNRHNTVLTECKKCNKSFYKQFKEILKSNNDFCSHSCSAKFNNKGRKMSEKTKQKIRLKLQIIRYTKCEICSKEIIYTKRKKKTCGEKCLADLKRLNYKKKAGIIIEEY